MAQQKRNQDFVDPAEQDEMGMPFKNLPPKRKYVKKHSRFNKSAVDKAPTKDTPEFTTATAADSNAKRNAGAQLRRWAQGIKKGPEWKRLKTGWKCESKPTVYPKITSYYKVDRQQFNVEQFFSELESECQFNDDSRQSADLPVVSSGDKI